MKIKNSTLLIPNINPPSFMPRNIDIKGQHELGSLIAKISVSRARDECRNFLDTYAQLCFEGWHFFVVAQKRGRCYWDHRVITIPTWAFNRTPDYVIYYISHEMAHAVELLPSAEAHGQKFQEHLKRICPEECWHYEIAYKPKAAIAAGILPEDF